MRGRPFRSVVVLYLAASLALGTPVFAQTQSPPAGQSQKQPAPQYPNLMKGRDYSKGKPALPDFFSPYWPVKVPEPTLTNSPTIYSLIHDGKLELSLEEAISLALENNLDISVERYVPWFAQTDLLRTKGGGTPNGQFVLGSGGGGTFDPVIFSTLSLSDSVFPVNNPLISGVGTAPVLAVQSHSLVANFGYAQTLHTGTSFSVQFNNTRDSTTSAFNSFNPSLQSTLSVNFQQPLLRGFGLLPNTRFILEAKNETQQDNLLFQEQVIASTTQVENQYWQLVFAGESVKVQEAALATSQKLYEDNKRQLEIGTLAPLDVLTAESEIATDKQNLIVAQTNRLQQETLLLNLITKNPLDAALQGVEIVPTTPITELPQVPEITLPDAVREAWANRPELKFDQLGLNSAGIEIHATRNELLPSLTLGATYQSAGLGGIKTVTTQTPTAFGPDPNAPIFSNGAIVPNEFAGIPITFASATTILQGGLGDALDSLIHNNFPTYAASLTLNLPIRNRSAQADSARALLNERQLQTEYIRDKNTILVNVRNALIALQQGKAQVDAAMKATQLAQQTLNDEQKKYQLGASTSYNVILRSRDLTTAEGSELQAKINLEIAMVNFNQAMGRTLNANNITIADAQRGRINPAPLIPGTIQGKLATDIGEK